MGIVYAARDTRLERTVALKTLRPRPPTTRPASASGARPAPPRASTTRTSARSTKSARRAGSCSSRWSCSRAKSCPSGCGAGRSSASEAMPIALGILAALSALHARGIIHRDLKPSNVFLTVTRREAARLRPRPPAARDAARRRDDQTRTGMVLGTPRYMAPEQVTGEPSTRGAICSPRRDPLRDARRPAGVRRPDDCRSHPRHVLRATTSPDGLPGRCRGGPRDPSRAGQAAGRSAAIGGGDGGGASRASRARTTAPRRRWPGR